MDIDKVKELLTSQDYITKIHQIDDHTCKVTFPQNITKKPAKDRLAFSYELKPSASMVQVTDTNSERSELWSGPPYALRMMILCDIIRNMKKLGMDPQLINYYDKNGEAVNRLEHIMKEPDDENSRTLEGFLSELFDNANRENFPPMYNEVAETHGVYTGYRLLKSFF